MRVFVLNEAQQGELLKLCMESLLPRLLAARSCYERLGDKLVECSQRLEAPERHLLLAIEGLQNDAETFLTEAHRYLRDALAIFRIFFGCNLDKGSDLANMNDHPGGSQLYRWSCAKFGVSHPISEMIKSEHNWVEELCKKRNAAEHPDGISGTLTIKNIEFIPQGARPPTWTRTGVPPSDVMTDMATALENMLTLAEDWLCLSMLESKPFPTLAIAEIPQAERDPICPIRFRPTLAPGTIPNHQGQNS